ncbi:MAG: hypothetical protein ABIK09_01810 [Pseudomonadota bacterium]
MATLLDAGESEDGEDVSDDDSAVAPTARPRRLGWAQLLRRVLAVDALTCPKCATSMTVLAFSHGMRIHRTVRID